MRIIIVGCGKVGSELAGQLSAAGHDLTLIDLSERRLNELSNMYDLATVKAAAPAITFCVKPACRIPTCSSPLPPMTKSTCFPA